MPTTPLPTPDLPAPTPADPAPQRTWGFTHDADLEQGVLHLLFSGDDPLGFGLPGTADAAVTLTHALTDHDTALPASIVDSSTIRVPLGDDWPAGWWDVTLTVTQRLTGLSNTRTVEGLVFGDVTRAVLELVGGGAGSTVAARFGEQLTMRLVEPVGRTLAQIGLTSARVQPRVVDAGGGFATPARMVAFADRTMTFEIGPRHTSYDVNRRHHAIDPGFSPSVPLQVPVMQLPLFDLLPLGLTATVVAQVLRRLVVATVPQAQLAPGVPAVWNLKGRSRDELASSPPSGMPVTVLQDVLRLLFDGTTTVELTATIGLLGAVDHTGHGTAAQRARSDSGPRAATGLAHVADFGLLRPRILRQEGGEPPGASQGSQATLHVSVTARCNDPLLFTGPVTVDVPAIDLPTIVQLPLAVPSLAVLFDGKYDRDFRVPDGSVLVLAPHSGVGTLSTTANGEAARAPLTLAASLLRTLDATLPQLAPVFAGIPGVQDLGGNPSPLRMLADMLNASPTTTVMSHDRWTDLGALGGKHPGYNDHASSLLLVGLPSAQRTLRLFVDKTLDSTRSAWLDLRVPPGHLVACLWTLHESLFQDGYGPRAPFRAVTEPWPKGQHDDAKRDARRPDMPDSLFGGPSFGNHASAYLWHG